MANHLFIIPGLGNSGDEHWQTYFEKSGSTFIRIEQEDWDTPNCLDWIDTIEKKLAHYDVEDVILIGHSLGCIAIAHWANTYHKKIKAALLVAPSDIETPQYASFPATGFTPIPLNKLNFKTIVVASTNDEWVTMKRAEHFASNWGSTLIQLENAGHINAASGFGEWKEGLEILKELL